MLFPVSAFKDHRSRLTLCGPLKGHCPSHLSQRDCFPLSMGASLTYSMYPSPESRPYLMKAQSKKRVWFHCAPLTDHSCLLSPHKVFLLLRRMYRRTSILFRGNYAPGPMVSGRPSHLNAISSSFYKAYVVVQLKLHQSSVQDNLNITNLILTPA